jgi:raffinose/stachyose/melibiose transport system permease protein
MTASRPPGEPRRIAYLYLLPAFAVYAAFLLYPIGRAVQLSLYDWDGLSLGRWVGLDNYLAIVADEGLRAAFGHALVLIVFYAVGPLVIGLALAAILNHAKVRGLGFFRTVVFLPQVIAMVVVAVAWRRVYAPDGTLNALLGALGLDSLTRGWLGEHAFALPAVGVVGTWFETGLVAVLLLAGMSRVPMELYEAARLDGAGAVREFFAVTLPSVRGEIAVALTLTVIAALRTFDLVYVTTRGGPATRRRCRRTRSTTGPSG